MVTKTGVDIIASAQLILDKVEKMKYWRQSKKPEPFLDRTT